MPRFRGYQGMRRRNGPRPSINTYKKVLNFLEASFPGGSNDELLVTTLDGISPTQVTNIDATVPTGSILKFIEIHFAGVNNGATGVFISFAVQYALSGQASINAEQVGGNSQRNQVLHQALFTIGPNQNSSHIIRLKIPKRFHRLKEGMKWHLTWTNSGTINREILCIYKFQH